MEKIGCKWSLAEEGQTERVALVRKAVGGVESLVVFGFGVERRASMEDAAERKVRRSWSYFGRREQVEEAGREYVQSPILPRIMGGGRELGGWCRRRGCRDLLTKIDHSTH